MLHTIDISSLAWRDFTVDVELTTAMTWDECDDAVAAAVAKEKGLLYDYDFNYPDGFVATYPDNKGPVPPDWAWMDINGERWATNHACLVKEGCPPLGSPGGQHWSMFEWRDAASILGVSGGSTSLKEGVARMLSGLRKADKACRSSMPFNVTIYGSLLQFGQRHFCDEDSAASVACTVWRDGEMVAAVCPLRYGPTQPEEATLATILAAR